MIRVFSENRVHFIGIGGIGMSGLAAIMLDLGYTVSGSDLKNNSSIEVLNEKGLSFSLGHNAENIGEAELVIISSAIPDTNPELEIAKERKLKILGRGEALATIANSYEKTIIILGSHGKTSSASMLLDIFTEAGLNPGYFVGGRLENKAFHAASGQNIFITEADESDGSYKNFNPDYVLFTNLDPEHLDFYGSFENLKNHFRSFFITKAAAKIIFNSQDPNLKGLFADLLNEFKTFSFEKGADFEFQFDYSEEDSYKITGRHKEESFAYELKAQPEYQVYNSAGCFSLATEFGIAEKNIISALSQMRSVKRRFEKVFRSDSLSIIDDYAHHPEEIRLAVRSASRLGYKLCVVFQPHRQTRFSDNWDFWASSFESAEYIFVKDIYLAGESPKQGKSARDFVDQTQDDRFNYTGDKELTEKKILDLVKKETNQKLLILCCGAGDVTAFAQNLAKKFTAFNSEELVQ